MWTLLVNKSVLNMQLSNASQLNWERWINNLQNWKVSSKICFTLYIKFPRRVGVLLCSRFKPIPDLIGVYGASRESISYNRRETIEVLLKESASLSLRFTRTCFRAFSTQFMALALFRIFPIIAIQFGIPISQFAKIYYLLCNIRESWFVFFYTIWLRLIVITVQLFNCFIQDT